MTQTTPKPLETVIVALSEGAYQDLPQLGFLPEHPEHVMQRCLRYIFLAGGRVAYGGDLSESGITFDVVRAAAQAYGGKQNESGKLPFIHVIAEYLWRKQLDSGGDGLFQHFGKLCSCGEVWLTFADDPARKIAAHAYFNAADRKVQLIDSAQGLSVEVESPDALKAQLPGTTRDFTQRDDVVASLTSMRRVMAAHCDLWISAGGKFSDYLGAKPGIAEEALYAIEAGKPVFPLGAFGGCARDIASALNLLTDEGPTPGRKLTAEYLASINDIRSLRDSWRARLPDDCHAAVRMLANAENPDQAETALCSAVQTCGVGAH